jgi:plastocyanin
VALAVLALAAALLLVLPGVGLAAERTIHIADGALSPKILTIAPGTTVTWVNDEGNRHRMRSTSGPAEFDSGDLDPGASFSFTFTLEGTHAYRDERNKDDTAYQGTVVVSAAATPAPTPPGATLPPGSTPAPPAAPPTVQMAGRVFRPATVTIDAGQSVVFLNDDSRDHTATARDGSFDTGTLAPGQRATRTFGTPGTFSYFCVIHPDMVGTIAVRGAAGSTPPPPPPPTPTPIPAPIQPPQAGGVAVVDYTYRPATLTVTAGATVTWVNQGTAPHTVTANDGSFDSGVFYAGARYARTFTVPGTFPYRCTLHPQMIGTLLVAPKTGGPIPTPRPTPKPTPSPTPPPATATTLDAADLFFRPETISVPAGTTLTWRNVGVAPHTVTSRDGSFDSGIFNAGATWSRTFAAPGTFPYLCAVHPQMTGTVVVTLRPGSGSAGASPDPGASSGPEAGATPSAAPALSPGAAASSNPGGAGGVPGTGGEAAGGGGAGGAGAAPGAGAPSAPAPLPTAPIDPLRLALVGTLVLGSIAAFGAVIRGLVPVR